VNVLIAIVIVLLAVAGTAVVFTREHPGQAMMLSFYGFVLALLLVLLQAPTVALSEIVVGAVGVPMIVLLVLARAHGPE
jgi:uncharacterized MnhB-related membrane protein